MGSLDLGLWAALGLRRQSAVKGKGWLGKGAWIRLAGPGISLPPIALWYAGKPV